MEEQAGKYVEDAQGPADGIARISHVLQDTLDATATLTQLDELVPRVLRTICNGFGAQGAALFENVENDSVRLLYWDVGGVTLTPEELLRADDEGELTIRTLAQGFQSPAEYVDTRKLGITVLDHVAGTSIPEFDRFCLRHGFWLELNIGVGASGRRLYTLCIYRATNNLFSPEEIELAQVLAAQLGLTLQTHRLAEESKKSAVLAAVAERERAAAEERAAALERGNLALKEVANSVSTAKDLDEIVPTVLRVIATTFGAEAAGYFNVSPDDSIHLRRWLIGERVFTATELLQLEDVGQHSTAKRLVNGFRVPDTYLGVPVSRAVHGVFINHVSGTSEPGFDQWLVDEGWGMELNVPLVLADRSVGAVTLHRANDRPYTEGELRLAEALVKQLTLAVQFVQLSDEVRTNALIRERQAAAQQRAAELAKANAALRRGAARLAESSDIESLVRAFLSEAIQASSAHTGAVFLLAGSGTEMYCSVHIAPEGAPDGREWTDLYPAFSAENRGDLFTHILNGPVTSVPLDGPELAELFPEIAAWHRVLGHRIAWNVPMRIGDQPIGFIGLAFRDAIEPSTVVRETLETLAMQVALAVEITRLSDQARVNAVALEREAAAQERATELAKANEVLRRGASRLAESSGVDALVSTFLEETIEASKAHAGAAFLLTGDGTELRCHAYLVPTEASTDADWLRLFPEFSRRDQDQRFTKLLKGPIVSAALDSESAFWYPELDIWHRTMGHRKAWSVPLRIGDRPVGFLGLAFCSEAEPTLIQRETLFALATQVALALEVTRLSDRALEAAISLEREKAAQERAAELSRANQVLRSTLDRLAEKPDLESFLRNVLLESMRQLDSHDAIAMRYEPETNLLHILELITQEAPRSNAEWMKSLDADITPAWGAMCAARTPLIFDVDEAPDMEYFWPGTVEWHRSLGNRCCVCIPLLMAGQAHGYLSFALRVPKREVSQAQLELVSALTQQVTLAMYMTELAEKASEAVAQREREKAAQELAAESQRRVLELTEMNAGLRRNLLAVVEGTNPRQTIERLLFSAAEQMNAVSATIFLYNDDSQTLERTYAAGPALPENESDRELYFALCDRVVDVGSSALWRRLSISRQPSLLDLSLEEDAALLWPNARVWHRVHKHRFAFGLPLFSSERVLGLLGFNFSEGTTVSQFTEDHYGLAQSLASMASMAIESHQLSLRAQDAAVAQERARISGEMHDGVQQIFTAISFQLGTLAKSVARSAGPEMLLPQIERTAEIAEQGIREVRRSIRALRDIAPLSQEELIEALHLLCRSADTEQTRCEISVDASLNLPASSRLNELHRIAQEAVGNAYRHAKSSHVWIRLSRVDKGLLLEIEDDGCGFEQSLTSHGYGLQNIRDRARLLGAEISIRSNKRGTLVRLEVPRVELL